MPLHPAPTIATDLGLIVQPLRHASVGRDAIVTCSVFNAGAASAQVIVNHWQTRFNADLLPFFDTDCTALQPTINLGNGSNVPTQATATGATGTGTITSAMPPPQVATLFRKITGLGGRHNRGRMYFPWMCDEADLDEAGHINATPLASKQTNATLFLGHLNTDQIPMVISNKTLAVDPVTGKKYVTAINIGPVVSTLLVEGIVATQRRRLPR